MAFNNTPFSSSFGTSIFTRVNFALLAVLIIICCGCGGGGGGGAGFFGLNNSPGGNATNATNVGDGYTLIVSGGILSDGSGGNGLVVLATLRDDQGYGPSLPWSIDITGPSISSPLSVEYQDGRPGSLVLWEWADFKPSSGTYRATATNFDGTVTIYYDFTITSSSSLARPAPSTSSVGGNITLSWSSVSGAASYTYEIYPSAGGASIFGSTNGTSVDLGSLANGDYLVRIAAYTADLVALDASLSSSPALPIQTNDSERVFTFPVGGDETSSSYSLNAAGGVLDFGLRGPGNVPIYGLAVWTSILYGTPTPNAAPPGDWNVKITDPNGRILDFIYPSGDQHYAYWFYDIEPVIGTYTVTASYGTASKTVNFTLSNLTPGLTLPTGLSASKLGNNDISMSWTAVGGAKSYYLSLWADVWNNATKQYEYTEVFAKWVNTNSATITNGSVTSGLTCYAYVTADQVDMTSATPPGTLPTRSDMSENYYGYQLPFATP